MGAKRMSTARATLTKAITEKQFQAQIVEAARALRFHEYHVFDSRRTHPGWPDLILVRGPRLLFAELKTEKGKLTPAQEWWLTTLGEVAGANRTVEVYVWRPSQWAEIVEVLRRGE